MSVRQIVPDVVAQFRQELTDLVKSVEGDELDPRLFAEFVDGLKAVLTSAGREAAESRARSLCPRASSWWSAWTE